MPTELFEFAACVLDGKLYILNGLDREAEKVCQFARYDPAVNAWEELELHSHSALLQFHGYMSALNGKLYLVGQGNDGRYDPVKNEWEVIAPFPLNAARHCSFATVPY